MLVTAGACFCLREENRKLSECVRDDFDQNDDLRCEMQ